MTYEFFYIYINLVVRSKYYLPDIKVIFTQDVNQLEPKHGKSFSRLFLVKLLIGVTSKQSLLRTFFSLI